MLSQLRSGGVEFFTLSGLILSTLVPAASINGIGFAFRTTTRSGRRWTASSAPISAARSTKANLVAMDKIWDNGFRQITSSTKPINGPDDLQGLQDPRPGDPAVDLDVQGVRRGARARSTSARSIRRCRPRSSTARRTRWRSSRRAKLYEVQKFCSLTNHMWDGFWFLANRRAWEGLPADLQDDRRQEHQRRGRARSARTSPS